MTGTVTVPAVELMKVGLWEASTGRFEVTPDLIAATVAAHRSTRIPAPVVRLGHDPSPGAPAYGRVVNLRASADGRTLLGDLAGVPADFAASMRSTHPHRSIEGEYDYRDAAGDTHDFVLTGLALLGAVPPAVHGLAEIAASAGRRVVRLSAPAPADPRLTLAAARRRRNRQRKANTPCR